MPTRDTNDAFDEYDENLNLDPDERRAAQKLHNEITDLLKALGIIIYAFLQGSFARKTMIAPLRDVDKVVVLSPAMGDKTPDQAMDAIEEAVADKYPDVTFTRSRHALQADFGAESFYFDMVPAWETTTNDDDVCIANRETGGWERSNTRELIRVVSARNQATNGRFIHQVRMAKQAIKHLLDGVVPGLHVESWAYAVITTEMAHDEALLAILEAGASMLGTTYYEPTRVDAISNRLKPEVIAKAKPVLEQAAADARKARLLTQQGKHEAAIAIWHAIFGDCFPKPSGSDISALQASFLGSGITSTGKVSPKGTQKATPTRSWRSA